MSIWDGVRTAISGDLTDIDDEASTINHNNRTSYRSRSNTNSSSNNKTTMSIASVATDDDDDYVSTTNDGSTGHEMVDRTYSMVDGGFSSSQKDASFICAPYKMEVFQQQLDENCPGSARRSAIISALQDLGVKVFIIDSISTPTTADILHHVKRVVGFIARENRVLAKTGPLGYQRCLLYQDHQGRLFNLMLSKHSVGPAGLWQDYLYSFSGLQAVMAVMILCRSLPCAATMITLDSFSPAYLSLVLGLVLTEEISLSWINASMLVRAAPSISAHSLISPLGSSDLIRKVIVLILAIAGVARGTTQQYLTLTGISLAMMGLLANLGSRAWHFLRWKPQRYEGVGAPVFAYMGAILTGAVFPYMGHRNIEVGGKAAMEYVIRTSFLAAVAFVVSDIDEVQEFLVVGSQDCNQDTVNITVGVWWFATLFFTLIMVRRIPYFDQKPIDAERLLLEDHASPAGYRVPTLPDYEIDPALAHTGIDKLSITTEFLLGLVMAFLVGGCMVFFAFTTTDEDLMNEVGELIPDFYNRSF